MAIDGGSGGRRSVCLVGQTEPLDRRAVLTEASKAAKEGGKEEKEEECRFYNTRSNDQPYSVSFTTASICRLTKSMLLIPSFCASSRFHHLLNPNVDTFIFS